MDYKYFHFLLIVCIGSMAYGMDSDESQIVDTERTLERLPRTPLLAVGAVCSNFNDVSIHTSDKKPVMVARRFVEESTVLRQTMRQVDGGFLASVAMTEAEFTKMIPYLTLGAEVTRLEKEKQALNPLLCNEFDPLIEDARGQLIRTIAGYDLKTWNACRKAARKLGLTRVNEVAVAVGRKNGWIAEPKKA